MMRFLKAQYLIPIGGTIRHQRTYLELAKQLGYRDNQVILLKEGETFVFEPDKAYRGDEVETKNVFVDAYGVGDVGNIVLRDRKTLSTEGIVVTVLVINQQFELTSRPEFISRGFIFKADESSVIEKARRVVENALKPKQENRVWSENTIKSEVIRLLEQHFVQETGRRPLVVVEVLQV